MITVYFFRIYVILGIKPFTITFKPKGSNTQADKIFPDIQPYFRFCKVHFTIIIIVFNLQIIAIFSYITNYF